MTLDAGQWHNRFRIQAQWTEPIRARWFKQAGFPSASRILEVGCGTGALLEEIPIAPSSRVIGLDLRSDRLAFAASIAPHAGLFQGNARRLPFASRSVDIVYSHFFFLWLQDPIAAVREMHRVVRPGGYIIAFAEPDYSARIDFPEELASLGRKQTEALRKQGATPDAGRRIASIFADAGLQVLEVCILGGQWSPGTQEESWRSEWAILHEDLPGEFSDRDWQNLQEVDQRARKTGTHVLFVPTFCVLAIRPSQ